jgi:4-amino-4-deoxychorismate lyase
MHRGCERLGLRPVTEQQWLADIAKLDLSGDAVIKLMLTSGSGGRGYRRADPVSTTRLVAAYDFPDYPASNRDGVQLRMCNTPVSMNSALAGIKHLNRLDSVLARNEWQDDSIAEGLMCDDLGHVVEGTVSNVFGVQNHALYTPVLKRSGIEGIIRQQVIELAKASDLVVQQVAISREQLLQMDEVFLTNSLIGIWPVIQIDKQFYEKGEVTAMLMERLDMEQGAYAL